MNSSPRSREFGEIGLLGWRKLPPDTMTITIPQELVTVLTGFAIVAA
jgi:hypothetical protein